MSINADFFNGEPVGMGACDLFISDDDGTTLAEVGILGETTTSTELIYEEVWKESKSKNGGDEPEALVFAGHKVTIKFTLDKILNKNIMNEFSQGLVNDNGTLKALRSKIGTIAKQYYVRFHPRDMGADTSLDVILPNCAFKTKMAWSGKLEDMLNMEFEGTGFYSKESGSKLEIGAPALVQG